MPINTKPERFIHQIILLAPFGLDPENDEIIEAAREIVVTNDDHKYVDDIITRLGWKRTKGLSKIIDLVSENHSWQEYVENVSGWLESKIQQVREL